MTDFRIGREQPGGAVARAAESVVQALVHGAAEVGAQYSAVAAKLPYADLRGPDVLDVPELARQIGAATWRRFHDEVPDYAFAEEAGRRYREAGASPGDLLLHWQVFRRAVHLVLAERRIRTGEGDPSQLREMTLMNYAVDWSTEASLVGYQLAGGRDGGGSG